MGGEGELRYLVSPVMEVVTLPRMSMYQRYDYAFQKKKERIMILFVNSSRVLRRLGLVQSLFDQET